MARSNCFLHAFSRWRKRPRTTYLMMRISWNTIWPHFFFVRSIEGLEVEEFKPLRVQVGLRAFFHAFRFEGRVRVGIGEEQDGDVPK